MADQKTRQNGIRRFFFYQPDLVGCLTEVMQVLLLGAAFAIPVSFLKTDQHSLLAAWLAAGWLLLYLTRLVVRRFWQFLALSAAIVLSPVFVPGWLHFQMPVLNMAVLIGGLAILIVRAFAQRLTQNKEKRLPALAGQFVAVLFLFVLDLAAAALKLDLLVRIYFYAAIVYLILVIVRWHSRSLSEQLERFVKMPTQPASRIMKFNRLLLAIFAVVLLGLLLASPWLRLHELVPLLAAQLLAVLRWIIKLIASLFKDRLDEPLPSETTVPSSGGDPQLPEAGETPAWLQLLQEILMYAFMVLAALIILALVVILFVWLYRRFNAASPSGTDTHESLLPDIRSQVEKNIRRSAGKILQRFSQDPDQRIRRLYYRLVNRAAKPGISRSGENQPGKAGVGNSQQEITWQDMTRLNILTPRQIADLIGGDHPDTMQAITALYEKARYGNKLCTKADVKQMQQLCREM